MTQFMKNGWKGEKTGSWKARTALQVRSHRYPGFVLTVGPPGSLEALVQRRVRPAGRWDTFCWGMVTFSLIHIQGRPCCEV